MQNNVPGQSPELTFVNISDPSNNSPNTRRLVRSTATTYSHRNPSRRRRRRDASTEDGAADSNASEGSATPQTPLQDAISLFQTSDLQYIVEMGTEPPTPEDFRLRLLHLDGGHIDPFDAFPVPGQPWFHSTLDWYRRVYLPSGVAIVQQSIEEGQRYITWLMRESISEPAFFYFHLFIACTPLVVEGSIPHATFIWVRGKCVTALNEALGDPNRQLSLAVLFTVLGIAVQEWLYGDRTTASQTHGQAFVRMLAMKGGIRALRVPRITFKLIDVAQNVLSAGEWQDYVTELLGVWAPAELRENHPGYR